MTDYVPAVQRAAARPDDGSARRHVRFMRRAASDRARSFPSDAARSPTPASRVTISGHKRV